MKTALMILMMVSGLAFGIANFIRVFSKGQFGRRSAYLQIASVVVFILCVVALNRL